MLYIFPTCVPQKKLVSFSLAVCMCLAPGCVFLEGMTHTWLWRACRLSTICFLNSLRYEALFSAALPAQPVSCRS